MPRERAALALRAETARLPPRLPRPRQKLPRARRILRKTRHPPKTPPARKNKPEVCVPWQVRDITRLCDGRLTFVCLLRFLRRAAGGRMLGNEHSFTHRTL